MNTDTIHQTQRREQHAMTRSRWIAQAGHALYQAVQPAGGLDWHELTPGQRLSYIAAAQRAVDALDVYGMGGRS